jgi:arginase family enzyme
MSETRELIRALSASLDIVGLSVVEYCEHREDDSLSALKDLIRNCGIVIGANRGGTDGGLPKEGF